MRRMTLAAGLLALAVVTPAQAFSAATRTIDGSGNNLRHGAYGQAGTQYLRVGRPNYADGRSAMRDGPDARYVSNRIFNDLGQNVFSEHNISQWGWAWGQFIDHDMGLRDETPGADISIPYDAADPVEEFANDFGAIGMNRTPAAPGTGAFRARQHVNTLTSFLDASQIYGSDAARDAWLRDGAHLLLPGGYLPRASDKPDAPSMDYMGQLQAHPEQAVIAGDVRANENIALTSLQTLFAREHNRIVDALPESLSSDSRFQYARRILGAEIAYITYTEFLPALGIQLPTYRGYNPFVNPGLSNEFATTGFRAHSMVHGEFIFDPQDFDQTTLDGLAAVGAPVTDEGLIVPLNLAFGNPDMVETLGIGQVLGSLGTPQYRNDELLDNTVRSILFQVPITDPSACDPEVVDPGCFDGVVDLGALDIVRARDHGIPLYNDLRRAYGLRPVRFFTDITGEATSSMGGFAIDDPASLAFTHLFDIDGAEVDGEQDNVTRVTRATTTAARLRAIYGSVDKVDAFTGMVSERHARGSEFGPLQAAMWREQFTRLRDGDRFFYATDPFLAGLAFRFGLTYRHTLADIVRANTDADVADGVFQAVVEETP